MDKMDSITITRGEAKDIATIMPVMNMAFDPEYGEAWNDAQCISMMALPYTHLYLAYSRDEICGFAFTRAIYEDVELLMLATHPQHVRQGIATSLMREIIADAICNKRSRIFLEMRDGNSAQHLYDLFEFEQINVRIKYYRGISGTFYDAITKQLLL